MLSIHGCIQNSHYSVVTCCRKKKRSLHSETKIYVKKTFWAGKANLGVNDEIGIYRHHKNIIRTLLYPQFVLIHHKSLIGIQGAYNAHLAKGPLSIHQLYEDFTTLPFCHTFLFFDVVHSVTGKLYFSLFFPDRPIASYTSKHPLMRTRLCCLRNKLGVLGMPIPFANQLGLKPASKREVVAAPLDHWTNGLSKKCRSRIVWSCINHT